MKNVSQFWDKLTVNKLLISKARKLGHRIEVANVRYTIQQ